MLAGSREFTQESKVWKRRHGGDLISLYPYILSSDYYFKQRIPKMGQYHEEAKELATLYNQCQGVETMPVVPTSNMFHAHFNMPQEKLELILIRIYKTTNVGLTSFLRATSDTTCYCEVSIGDLYSELPKDKVRTAFQQLDEEFRIHDTKTRG
ncbi:hypothetical protein D3C76_1207780 [compost metagenome]